MVHAELEHAVGRLARHARQRQRHAPVIVEAAGRGESRPAGAERQPQRLLGAGLADAAGDARRCARCCGRAQTGRAPSSAASVSPTRSKRRIRRRAADSAVDQRRGRAAFERRRRRNRGRHDSGPRSATKRSPGASRCGCRSRRRSRAPIDGAACRRSPRTASAAVHSAVTSRSAATHASAAGDLARNLGVVERQRLAADDLAALVALAGDAPARSPGRASAIAVAIAPRAVADLDGAGARGEDRAADRGRVFAARIVVGDDDAVGEHARRCAPISGRLPGSRSPPQPNTTTSRPRRVRAQRREHRLERIGRVGVVDDDRRAVGVPRRRTAAGPARPVSCGSAASARLRPARRSRSRARARPARSSPGSRRAAAGTAHARRPKISSTRAWPRRRGRRGRRAAVRPPDRRHRRGPGWPRSRHSVDEARRIRRCRG